MKPDTLEKAMTECARFQAKAIAAKFRLDADSLVGIVGSKETAAAIRASMDLTRALAELRK